MARKKEEILKEIAKLFFEKGYEKTSIRDIGKALNMTNSGLYYHFENKQEMLFAIISDIMGKVIGNLRENLELIQQPEDKLLYIIQNHIRFFVKYPAQTKVVIYEAHSLEEEYAASLKEKQLDYVKLVKQVLKEIIRKADTSIDINVATFCLLGMLNWIVQWYKPHGRVSPENLARDINNLYLNGI